MPCVSTLTSLLLNPVLQGIKLSNEDSTWRPGLTAKLLIAQVSGVLA